MPRSTSQNFCCQCPCPHGEIEPPPPLQETLQHQQVGLVQSPPGSLLLSLGPDVHTTLCVSSKSGVSVSPSPVKALQSIPTRLQSLILQEFLLPLPDPQVRKPDVGLRTFTPVRGLLWYKCSPVCESPTHQLWDLIYCYCAPPTISLWLLLCLWMWGIFFGELQCLPVDDCPAASCDSGVLTRGSESTSFYSAILVPLHSMTFNNSLLPTVWNPSSQDWEQITFDEKTP